MLTRARWEPGGDASGERPAALSEVLSELLARLGIAEGCPARSESPAPRGVAAAETTPRELAGQMTLVA